MIQDGGVSNGIYMIISPAKTFDLTTTTWKDNNHIKYGTDYCNYEKTNKIVSCMKQRNENEIIKLLGLSKSLGKISKDYWNDFHIIDDNEKEGHHNNMKPCIYTFSGPAYQGININSCTDVSIQYIQQYLRILDPVYGILKPLYMIQPYRLEMATKNVFNNDEKDIKLHHYWSNDVTQSLSNDLLSISSLAENDDNNNNGSCSILLNLASEELAMTIDIKQLPKQCYYVKVIFMVDNKVISVHAKRARGLMVRYIADNQCQSLNDIKLFTIEGYQFVKQEEIDKSQPKIITLYFNRSGKQKEQPISSTTKIKKSSASTTSKTNAPAATTAKAKAPSIKTKTMTNAPTRSSTRNKNKHLSLSNDDDNAVDDDDSEEKKKNLPSSSSRHQQQKKQKIIIINQDGENK